MAADQVEMQVISPIPVTFCYRLDPGAVAELCRVQNEWIAGVVRQDPRHFGGFGSVPLQDPDRAVEIVAEIMGTLDLSGVEIGSNVGGTGLDAPDYDEFFAACAETGAVVFIHPWDPAGADRLTAHRLVHSIAAPGDTAQAAASLVLGGVLDRHPDLRLLLAHGGGSFVPLLGRLDRTWEAFGDLRRSCEHRPSSYARRFLYDSLVYDPATLGCLVERVGNDRVVVGSDYPFALAERPAGAAVRSATLPAAERKAVLRANARELLGLRREPR